MIPITHPTITADKAKVLSSALSHSFYKKAREANKFFTPVEYRKCFSGIFNVCHKYALQSKGAVDNDEGISTAEAESGLNKCMVKQVYGILASVLLPGAPSIPIDR